VAAGRIGLRKEEIQVRDARVRDEALRAVEDVIVTVSAGSLRIAALSDPEPASVSAYAASHSPDASFGRKRCFWSPLPASLIPSEPSSWTARINALVPHTFATSSIATSVISALAPTPPCSSSKHEPEQTVLAEELDHVPRKLRCLVDLRGARLDPLAGERAHELPDLTLLGRQRVVRHGRESVRA